MKLGELQLVSLAEQIHEAKAKYGVAEDRITEAIIKVHGEGVCGDEFDFTTDYHDNSIEIYDAPPSDAVRDAMFRIGFDRVWQHAHRMPRGNCTCPCARRPRASGEAVGKSPGVEK